jgi:hypothetical protein
MVKTSKKHKHKTAKINGSYKNLKSSYSTRKISRSSRLSTIHRAVKNNNVNMHVKKIKTKKQRRSENPDTYLIEVKGLLELLTEGRDDFSDKMFERHSLIADSIMGSVSDVLRDIGRGVDEEEPFEFVDRLGEIIDEMLGEYEDAQGEERDGLKDEMYLLASSIREAMRKGNKIYKSLKKKPVLPTISENDGLEDLLTGLSSLKIKK